MLPGSDSGTTERVKGCRFRVSSFGSCPCLIANPSQSWRNSLRRPADGNLPLALARWCATLGTLHRIGREISERSGTRGVTSSNRTRKTHTMNPQSCSMEIHRA
jgi:hypothetical protein